MIVNENKGIHLDEEFKVNPFLEVPDEVYAKEYNFIDIPWQLATSIKMLEQIIRRNMNAFKINEQVY